MFSPSILKSVAAVGGGGIILTATTTSGNKKRGRSRSSSMNAGKKGKKNSLDYFSPM